MKARLSLSQQGSPSPRALTESQAPGLWALAGWLVKHLAPQLLSRRDTMNTGPLNIVFRGQNAANFAKVLKP